YNAADGKRVATLEGERGAIYALAWHPDGKTIASAGFDGVVRLNDPQTGKLIKGFSPVPLSAGGSGTGRRDKERICHDPAACGLAPSRKRPIHFTLHGRVG